MNVGPSASLEETIAPDLKGFLGHGPVRVGNQASDQIQNDVYGSVVLAATQMFVDERLPKMGDEALFRLLEGLGERAITRAFEPDAGLWEYRGRSHERTPTRRLCAGPPATGSPALPGDWPSPTAPRTGQRTRGPCASEF